MLRTHVCIISARVDVHIHDNSMGTATQQQIKDKAEHQTYMDHTLANTDREMDQHISRQKDQPRCTATLQDSNNNQTEMDRSIAEQFQTSNANRQHHAQTQ